MRIRNILFYMVVLFPIQGFGDLKYSSAMTSHDKRSQSHVQKTTHCKKKCHEWDRKCCPTHLDPITIPCAQSLIAGTIGIIVVLLAAIASPPAQCAQLQSQFLNAVSSPSSRYHGCTILYPQTLEACKKSSTQCESESMAVIRRKYYTTCLKVPLEIVHDQKTN